MRNLTDFSRDDVLAALHLDSKKSPEEYLTLALGTLGVGLLLGLGIGMMLAPRRGLLLRRRPTASFDEFTREELYERARERGVAARADMSKEELVRSLRQG